MHPDGLTAKRAMVGFQCPRLVGKPLPVIGPGPRQGENIMRQNVHGVHSLAELPVLKMRGAAKGVEEGAGGVGGTIATGLGPGLGPLDVILAGGGLDGQVNEALEETLAGRGDWLPVPSESRSVSARWPGFSQVRRTVCFLPPLTSKDRSHEMSAGLWVSGMVASAKNSPGITCR